MHGNIKLPNLLVDADFDWAPTPQFDTKNNWNCKYFFLSLSIYLLLTLPRNVHLKTWKSCVNKYKMSGDN